MALRWKFRRKQGGKRRIQEKEKKEDEYYFEYNSFREIANACIAVNYYFILHLIMLFQNTLYCTGMPVNGSKNDWKNSFA